MPNLFPTFEIPTEIGSNEGVNTYEKSVYFDFEKGDFLENAGMIQEANKAEMWKQWCMKQVSTQRYAYLNYSKNIGVEMEEAFAQPTKKAQESSIEKTITEAILADPMKRTTMVNNFTHTWSVDGVMTAFTLMGKNNLQASIQVNIKRGGVKHG